MNELVKIPFGDPQRVELKLPDGLSLDDWKLVGRRLIRCKDSLQFWIGDWINYGKSNYGDTYTDAMEVFGDEAKAEGGGYGYDQHSLECFASVARKVEPSIRIELLSFGHHQVVASKPPELQSKWLKDALDNDWSVSDLNAHIRASEKNKAVNGTSAMLGLWNWDTWFVDSFNGFRDFFKRVPIEKWETQD